MILWIASILFKTRALKHCHSLVYQKNHRFLTSLILSDPMEFSCSPPERFRSFGIPTNPLFLLLP